MNAGPLSKDGPSQVLIYHPFSANEYLDQQTNEEYIDLTAMQLCDYTLSLTVLCSAVYLTRY